MKGAGVESAAVLALGKPLATVNCSCTSYNFRAIAKYYPCLYAVLNSPFLHYKKIGYVIHVAFFSQVHFASNRVVFYVEDNTVANALRHLSRKIIDPDGYKVWTLLPWEEGRAHSRANGGG